jgi:hypothetical protein
VPLIEKQMLATYYKFSEEEGDNKSAFEGRIRRLTRILPGKRKG